MENVWTLIVTLSCMVEKERQNEKEVRHVKTDSALYLQHERELFTTWCHCGI